jgi:hypothetical protein
LPHIPASGEAKRKKRRGAGLKKALRGYLRAFGLDDALERIASPSIRTIELELADVTSG